MGPGVLDFVSAFILLFMAEASRESLRKTTKEDERVRCLVSPKSPEKLTRRASVRNGSNASGRRATSVQSKPTPKTNAEATHIIQYILNNPGKSIVLGLAGQAMGCSASVISQSQSAAGKNNLTREFMNESYPADHVSAIYRRVAPVSDFSQSNQMETVPNRSDTDDAGMDRRSHRPKRGDWETEVKNFLLSHDICLKNVHQNHEYLYGSNGYDNGHATNAWKVFTWTAGTRDPDAIWRFSKSDDGRSFYIYNIHHERFMYDTDDKWDGSRYKVKTAPSINGGKFKWRVQVLGSEGIFKYIALWNDWSRRQLYASDDVQGDGKRRYVFNWDGDKLLSKARWRVVNCDPF